MFGKLTIFGYLLILVQLSYQVPLESNSSDYYTAAVVEYSSIYIKNDAKSTLMKNAEVFANYIEQASKQNADIIVFPEYALTSIFIPPNANPFIWSTIIPSSLEGYIPCIESRITGIQEAVKRISCAARDNRIYVVINLIEKQFNKKNGTWHYYNTNIVFDRTGKIIARYRKINLYLEGNLESPVPSDFVTFDTDFGVKFGVIICFDMLFKEPALNLTRIEGVSNIVYSTAWLSSVPFLIAAQYQYGWAYAENVNLLAAGYNKPEFSFLGSGIYSGRNGILNTTMSSNPKNRLLISRLPKTPRKTKSISKWLKIENKMKTMERKTIHEEMFDLHDKPVTKNIDSILISHDNITWFNSVLLNDSMTRNICYGDFCCDFVIRTKIVDPSTYYRAVVYSGIRQFDVVVDANVRHCAIIQCSNESLASCYSINTSETTFSTLSVTARFDDYQDIQVLPSSLNSSLLPFEQWSFDEQTFGKQTKVIITLNKPTRNVLTFGLYARIFSKDIKH